MVLFLIGATCKTRHFLEGRRLLESGAYFDEDNQSCGAYFETRRLLEEFRYSSVKSGQKTFYVSSSVFSLYFISQDQLVEICTITVDNSEIT